VIAGERADQAVRELSPDHGFEPLERAGARISQARDSSTVVEEADDGSSVGRRRFVHGTLVIGAARSGCDPWRE
jgi:hypothetical protein